MREILFRGKTILDNEWVIGAGVYKSEGHAWIITDDVTKTENRGTGSDAIIPETVGQYTGLTDKNGNKIFEGDILSKGFDKVLVKWNQNQCRWGIYLNEYEISGFNESTKGYFEVIGNIYDNPELLRTPQNDEVRE